MERLGGETYLYVKPENSEEVIVHSSGDKVVSVGDFVGIDFSPQDCHIFDEKGGVFEKI